MTASGLDRPFGLRGQSAREPPAPRIPGTGHASSGCINLELAGHLGFLTTRANA